MKINRLLFVVLFFSLGVNAQYTQEINTNRPSLSMGAYSVSKGIFQVENGVGVQKDDYHTEKYTNHFNVDIQLRYGLLTEQLELIGDFKMDWNKQTFYEETQSKNGFRSAVIGAKYMIFDSYKNYVEKRNVYSWRANQRYKWRRLVPTVAVFVGADFKSTFYTHPEMPGITLKGMIITQQHITNHLSFVTNLIIENADTNEFRSYGYMATLSYGFNKRWSVFGENQGYFRKYKGIRQDFKNDCMIRGGLTYLVHNNLQVDLSGGTTIGNAPHTIMGQIGISWRNHKIIKKLPPEEVFIDN